MYDALIADQDSTGNVTNRTTFSTGYTAINKTRYNRLYVDAYRKNLV